MPKRQRAENNIPVEVNLVANESASLTATAAAVLCELECMLEALVSSGVENSVDLRSTPLTPREYRQLKTALGQGEVTAEVDSCGLTQIHETAVPGVWWVRYCNQDGNTQGEFIEVTEVPRILATQPEDLRFSARRLRARIAERLQSVPNPKYVKERLAELGLHSITQPQARCELGPSENGGIGNVE